MPDPAPKRAWTATDGMEFEDYAADTRPLPAF